MSAFSLVLFASNLSQPTEERKQLRRVMGRCDLPWHECPASEGVDPFAGPGWFGREDGDRTVSVWENEALLHDLHLSRGEDVGTSCAIVGFHDPSSDIDLTPADMVKEINSTVADCFWPDLTLGRLKVKVEHYEGREKKSSSEVAADEFRQEFVELLNRWVNDEDTVEVLKKPGDVAVASIPLEYPARREEPTHPAGTHQAILLVRAASEDEGRERLNSLAVFRGVGMVVQYFDTPGSMGAMPFHAALHCGEAAVRPGDDPDPASKAADRFLRTSEPLNHDKWTSTPDLGTEYFRGGKSAIDRFIKAAKDKDRDLVRPPTDDLSDGPEAIKELLKIGDEEEDPPVGAPYVYRPTGTPGDDGSWSVEARIKVKRGETAWLVEPVIKFQQETGAGVAVRWRTLIGTKNCTVLDGQKLLIEPNVNEAAFAGGSDPKTHLIDARESSIVVELSKCEKQVEADEGQTGGES